MTEVSDILAVYSSFINILYDYCKKNFPTFADNIESEIDNFNKESKMIVVVLEDSKIKFLFRNSKNLSFPITRDEVISFLNPLVEKLYIIIKKSSGSYNQEAPFVNIIKEFYRENKKKIDILNISFPECFKEDIKKLISDNNIDEIYFG